MSKSRIVTRPYNDIQFLDDKVVKTSDTDRIKKEYNWYQTASSYIQKNIPNTKVQDGKLYMNNIGTENLYLHLIGKDLDSYNYFLEKISTLLSLHLHKGSSQLNENDIKQMYLNKPIGAINDFKKSGLLDHNRSIVVNGSVCLQPTYILEKLFKDLKEALVDTEYRFIHGDLTMSNIVLNHSKELYLIDPRGGFGNTVNYGDTRYDVAKLYYSFVTGFDNFNYGNYSIIKSGQDFTIEINKQFSEIEKIFWNYFNSDRSVIKYIVCTIWLSLTPHLSTDEEKLTAYLYGTYLLNKLYV